MLYEGELVLVRTHMDGVRIGTLKEPLVKGYVSVVFEDGCVSLYHKLLITALSEQEKRLVRRLYNHTGDV